MNDRSTAAVPRGLLGTLFLGVLMAALDIAMVGPALPALREHFGLDERGIAWVFNVFVLFNLLGLPLMARLSDVAGRRTVYLVDIGLFAAGSLVVAAAPSFGVLLVGRALQGLGASGIFPVASAVVGDVFEPERRGRVLGLLGAVFGLAFIIGPITAGLLLLLGWRWIFVVNVPLAVVVAAMAWRRLPVAGAAAGAALDVRGIALLGGMLAALVYGISGIDATAFGASVASARVWPFLLAAAVLAPAFAVAEGRAEAPLLRLSLFQNRQVLLAALLAVGAGLTEAAFVFFPDLAVTAFGVDKATASFMLLPLTLAVAVGSPVMGRLLDRVGSRRIIISCTILLALGLGVMGMHGDLKHLFYTGSVLIGLGLSGLLGSALSYILLNEAHVEERTVAQGVITLAISIGQLIGAAVIGAVAASRFGVAGYLSAFRYIALVALVLALLAFGLKRRRDEQAALRGPGGAARG